MGRRSILWPPVVVGGRMLLTPDPDSEDSAADVELRQVIAVALLDCRNANPFNVEALGVKDHTFTAQSAAQSARLVALVRERFAAFHRERRARLVEAVIEREGSTLTLAIQYESLETGKRERMGLNLG